MATPFGLGSQMRNNRDLKKIRDFLFMVCSRLIVSKVYINVIAATLSYT